MRPYDLIQKKRDGGTLTADELSYLLDGFVRDRVPDYQMSAFLMAVFFRGMDPRETVELTRAMVRSGETLDLSRIRGTKVDKHSTGGVGDKTSLILIPLVAACGAPVAKLSGRGLGHTGGTIDKLESIPGFHTALGAEQFIEQVNRIGCAIAGQTANLVPADKKLYALRDVTATVDSVPLIASSVMSKKIAGGSDAIVLDVKTGSGAFMKTLDAARSLARTMVAIGTEMGRRTVAVISDMTQPLGLAIGNALEVREAIATLAGSGPEDLRELCLALGSHMLVLAGVAETPEAARARLTAALAGGTARRKFAEMVRAQGGDASIVDEPDRLPAAPVREVVTAPAEGFVGTIDAEALGIAAMTMGAGRAAKDDSIDPAVGIILRAKVGARVRRGEPLADLHLADRRQAGDAAARVAAAYRFMPEPPELRTLIREVIT
ncbi:MAG TPA: pyrimidine-nucleoside phosphorylase [bacterium]